jgi:hypothetical protein
MGPWGAISFRELLAFWHAAFFSCWVPARYLRGDASGFYRRATGLAWPVFYSEIYTVTVEGNRSSIVIGKSRTRIPVA